MSPIAFFLAILVTITAMVAALRLWRIETPIHRLLLARGFVADVDLRREVTRLDLLRIVTGALVVDRTIQVLVIQSELRVPDHQIWLAGLVLLLGFGLLVGLMTPLVAFIFMLGNQRIDGLMGIGGPLPSDILQILLFIVAFAPLGTQLAADAVLARRPRLGAPIRWLYRAWGTPTVERLAAVKLAAFLSFSAIALASALAHLNDPAWIDGYANTQILTSSYLTRFYAEIRTLYQAFPALMTAFGEVSIYLMMVWEMGMFVLLFLHRFARWFVIYWGLAFFLMSLIALQLGHLAHYELVLWAMLFWMTWKTNQRNAERITLVYDDRCGLCYRTVAVLRRLDLFGVLEIRGISVSGALIAERGLEGDDVKRDLHGWTAPSGEILSGYALYEQISRRLLLLIPLVPLLLVGRCTRIGPWTYAWVRRHRNREQVCRLPPSPPAAFRDGGIAGAPYRSARAVGVGGLLTVLVLFVVLINWFPHLARNPISAAVRRHLDKPGRLAAQIVGMTTLNVFNAGDLRMSEWFYTLHRVRSDGERVLVPFYGLEGERLEYYASDRMHFGLSLRWRRRRARAELDPACFSVDGPDMRALTEPILIDRARNSPRSRRYVATLYHQKLPPAERLVRREFVLPPIQLVCEVQYNFRRGALRRVQ